MKQAEKERAWTLYAIGAMENSLSKFTTEEAAKDALLMHATVNYDTDGDPACSLSEDGTSFVYDMVENYQAYLVQPEGRSAMERVSLLADRLELAVEEYAANMENPDEVYSLIAKIKKEAIEK